MIHELFSSLSLWPAHRNNFHRKQKIFDRGFFLIVYIQHFSVSCFCFSPLACDIGGPEGDARLQQRWQFNLSLAFTYQTWLKHFPPLSGLTPDATSACDGQSSNVAFVASKLNMQLYLVLQGSQLIANVFRLLCPAHQQQSWFTKHRVTKTKSYTNLWNHAKSPQTGSYVPPRWTEGSLSRLLPKWVGYIGHDPWCWYAFKA